MSLDDTNARKEWNWQHKYDLDTMTRDMIINLSKKIPPQVEIKGIKGNCYNISRAIATMHRLDLEKVATQQSTKGRNIELL